MAVSLGSSLSAAERLQQKQLDVGSRLGDPAVYGRMSGTAFVPTIPTQFHNSSSGQVGHPAQFASTARLYGNAVPEALGAAIGGRSIVGLLNRLR